MYRGPHVARVFEALRLIVLKLKWTQLFGNDVFSSFSCRSSCCDLL